MFPARQWGLVRVLTGGAGHKVTTKGLTGFQSKRRAVRTMRTVLGKVRAAPGEMLGRVFLPGRRTGGKRSACILKTPTSVEVFLGEGQYGLGGANSRM